MIHVDLLTGMARRLPVPQGTIAKMEEGEG
jgi:hypothetical protein